MKLRIVDAETCGDAASAPVASTTLRRRRSPETLLLVAAVVKDRPSGNKPAVNASLNMCGEPIAGSPEDAFRCFTGAEVDMLADENRCLDYKNEFKPD